ncbi:chemerin-like receptor 1 [Leptodactylus fuscus]|uniref:chemerin-like receptor 1 n=1 Tax=Leptodactylus fuscus TaxID=238119 RepID=UPI003F4EAE3D
MDQEIVENLCYMALDLSASPELRASSPNTSHPSAIQYSSFALSIVTCIIGMAVNIIVIFTTGFLMQKNKYKIWFLNLALADFIFLLFLPLSSVAIIRGKWPYGSNMCKLCNFLYMVNIYASIYILTALNIDRALSVAKPMLHLRFYSRRLCWCICTAIWVLSFLCSIPAIIYSDVRDGRLCSLSHVDQTNFANKFRYSNFVKEFKSLVLLPHEICRRVSGDSEMTEIMATMWREVTFTATSLVVPLAVLGYVIPLCVILVCNVIIALHVKKSKKASTSRLYRVVIVSVMSFFCTKTPCVLSCVTFLVSIYTMKITLTYKLSVIVPLLFSISATCSLLNPLVYVLVGKQVRSEIIHFFRKKFICYSESGKEIQKNGA